MPLRNIFPLIFEKVKQTTSTPEYLTGRFLDLGVLLAFAMGGLWSLITRSRVPDLDLNLSALFLGGLGVWTNIYVMIYQQARVRHRTIHGQAARLLGGLGILLWLGVGSWGMASLLEPLLH